MNEENDKQLIADYLDGNDVALEKLINQYLKPIYSFAYHFIGDRSEAEDITQETFIKIWRNLKKFDRNKKPAPYRTEGSGSGFKTWIFSIAKNVSLDFLKKKKAILFSEFEKEDGRNVIIDSLVDPSPLPQEILEKADMTKTLNVALEKLPPLYRMVSFLRYNDHFTFREIAEIFNESINTIKSRHLRAIAIIKKLLEDID